MPRNRWGWTEFPWDRITALAALAVALIALSIAVWQLQGTRRRDALSVKPILRVTRSDSLPPGPNALLVINEGAGPALIKTSSLEFDEQGLGPVAPATWSMLEGRLATMKLLGHLTYGDLTRDAVVQPGARRPVLTLYPHPSQRPLDGSDQLMRSLYQAEEFWFLTTQLRLHLCYCSTRGDCWVATWKYDRNKNSEVVSNSESGTCPHDPQGASR